MLLIHLNRSESYTGIEVPLDVILIGSQVLLFKPAKPPSLNPEQVYVELQPKSLVEDPELLTIKGDTYSF